MNHLNRCHVGDVRAVLRQMVAAGVQVNCIVTSPPYWGLRSYLPEGHPSKASEIGSEPTLPEFLATMVEVFDLCRQLLADDGVCWVNMGDAYAGSWGAQGRQGESGQVAGRSACAERQIAAAQRRQSNTGSLDRVPGIKSKDLMGQPWRLAFALQDAGWYLRQDVIWSKPNPMPESVQDRCTKAHEYLFLLSKSERYWWDFAAMQEPTAAGLHPQRPTDASGFRNAAQFDGKHKDTGYRASKTPGNVNPPKGQAAYEAGDEAHRTKGGLLAYAQKMRKTDSSNESHVPGATEHGGIHRAGSEREPSTRNRRSVWTIPTAPYSGAHFATFPPALVEPCILAGCPAGGIVLDPFMGSGTTGMVAQRLGRHWIGIDIDERNLALQADRIGPQAALHLEAA